MWQLKRRGEGEGGDYTQNLGVIMSAFGCHSSTRLDLCSASVTDINNNRPLYLNIIEQSVCCTHERVKKVGNCSIRFRKEQS